jgi:hypothetical protein
MLTSGTEWAANRGRGLDRGRASAILVAPLSRRAAAHAVLAVASLTAPVPRPSRGDLGAGSLW